jgi:hypothetical protein
MTDDKYPKLRDVNGNEIDVGDIVRITDKYYGIYEAPVIFRDGMFTIEKYEAKQIKNSEGWLEGLKKTFPGENKKHDQVKSYGFIIHWGETYCTPLKNNSIIELKKVSK